MEIVSAINSAIQKARVPISLIEPILDVNNKILTCLLIVDGSFGTGHLQRASKFLKRLLTKGSLNIEKWKCESSYTFGEVVDEKLYSNRDEGVEINLKDVIDKFTTKGVNLTFRLVKPVDEDFINQIIEIKEGDTQQLNSGAIQETILEVRRRDPRFQIQNFTVVYNFDVRTMVQYVLKGKGQRALYHLEKAAALGKNWRKSRHYNMAKQYVKDPRDVSIIVQVPYLLCEFLAKLGETRKYSKYFEIEPLVGNARITSGDFMAKPLGIMVDMFLELIKLVSADKKIEEDLGLSKRVYDTAHAFQIPYRFRLTITPTLNVGQPCTWILRFNRKKLKRDALRHLRKYNLRL